MYIQKLIQEYCPNGVEFKALGELIKSGDLSLITPSIKLKRQNYSNTGKTPIISQEAEYISGYCNINDKNIPEKEYVCFGDHSEHIKYVDFSFVQGADGLKIIAINNNDCKLKYIYYVLCNNYKKHNNYERHFKYFTDTLIPIPPIEVQNKIVSILDKFTEHTEELKNNLSKELILRKKQYEYYQEKLIAEQEVERLKICDVCSLSVGGDVPKERFSKELTSHYSVPIYSNGVGESALYGYTDISKIKEPCVTIAARGTIGYCEYRDEPFYPIIRLICAVPKKDVIAKYLNYAIRLIKFQVPETGIPQLTIPMLSRYTIPVPSLQEQERIVAILDKFDALCNDLTQGLPAEIELRKKQYEYYRDKLLTFKELVI